MGSFQQRTLGRKALALDAINALNDDVRREATATLATLGRMVSFEGFSISGIDIPNCELGNGIHLASSLPAEFLRDYSAGGLFRFDPMVKQVSPQTPVARWDAVTDEDLEQPGTHRLLAALQYYDIAPRTSITLWNGRRLYSALTFTRHAPFSQEEIDILRLAALGVHAQLARPVIEGMNRFLRLSDGEVICLELAAQGLTSEEIAVKTDYSADTVATYIKSATKKLNASNRTEAIAVALRQNLIQ